MTVTFLVLVVVFLIFAVIGLLQENNELKQAANELSWELANEQAKNNLWTVDSTTVEGVPTYVFGELKQN